MDGNTYFQPGDEVRSEVTTQGMIRGQTYTVVTVRETRTAFGNFVEYEVSDQEQNFWIQNLHMLATKI